MGHGYGPWKFPPKEGRGTRSGRDGLLVICGGPLGKCDFLSGRAGW